MDIFIIMFLAITFASVAIYYGINEDLNPSNKRIIEEKIECNHNFIETQYYGGICGGTQLYKCTKCDVEGSSRWSALD